MRNRSIIRVLILNCLCLWSVGQNSVFSPYSRFGLGEIAPTTFAHNRGMAGTHIAYKPDSTMPIFINSGNPASYSMIRLASLEVGGTFLSSTFTGANNSKVNRWGTNFSYASLGFPIKGNGGAAFGIMPYSYVGYETQSINQVEGVGNVIYRFEGNGGLTKAFIGYGVMPFNKRLRKFRTNRLYVPDSLKTISSAQYRRREFGSKLLSDFSLGFNVNYIFGTIQNATRVVYPNSSMYYNTYYSRVLNLGDFTGNFGAQTAFSVDSVKDHKKAGNKVKLAMEELRALNSFSEEQLKMKEDSMKKAMPSYNRALKEKTKFTFGFFMNLNNPLSGSYSSTTFNYALNGLGQELLLDTADFLVNQKGKIRLPLEQGFGVGFKKGERLNLVADFAITDWSQFQYLDEVNDLVANYRVSAGINFVPEKYAAGHGAVFRRINYRLGVSYETGYINWQNTIISGYLFSAGLGLPVGIGRLSSMVNISVQRGQTGNINSAPLQENYWRIHVGFTFCDRWFQKFRYD